MKINIQKQILGNGLTVLVCPIDTIPKVAVQLWYNVGSKDEKDGERGLAHLLEHMIFKGTQTLSESDINMITHKLSGSCNAFTSYDYTCYTFDFPKQNWTTALPLLADCMSFCTFKEDLLNAELKAVIQELKMYKDDYPTSLCESLVSTIFPDHPYHYPIIGYKQDLWSITRQNLLNFYKKHYIPNNATLVIVGDVDPAQAIEQATKAFESIPSNPAYKKESYIFNSDIISRSVTIKRDVQQPLLMYAWTVPGLEKQQHFQTQMLSWIFGEGKGSRLYKRLVDQEQLATDMQIDIYDLFETALLFAHIDPIDYTAIPAIEQIIAQELESLYKDGIAQDELLRAYKQARLENLSVFENNQKIAYELGKLYLATGSYESLLNIDENLSQLQKDITTLIKENMTIARMHKGAILPFQDEEEKEYWLQLQKESDKQDEKILKRKVRETTVECGVLVERITVNEAAIFDYPSAKKAKLDNGLTLLWHETSHIPKIDLMLDLKVRHYYDPEDQQGLINFMSDLMVEGTQQYPGNEFATIAESRGIGIDVYAGIISMSFLKEDLEFALDLLNQMVTKILITKSNIEKVRAHIASEILQFWDTPSEFAGQLIRNEIYKNHPYHRNIFGDLKSLKTIKEHDLLQAYKTLVVPDQAILSLVGDLKDVDISAVVKKKLGNWTGAPAPKLEFPMLSNNFNKEITHYINRDQTILCFAGLSVTRLDPLYEPLFLFDQIFTGGVLGSMSSYLFQLREQTGLFYTIGGSLVTHADHQPGLIYLRTIVSNDRLDEAQKLIEQAINNAADKMSEADLEHAKNAVINSMVEHFESNHAMAQAFIFQERFNLPADYFNKRVQAFKKINMSEVKTAVTNVLKVEKLIKLTVGRI